MKFKLEVTEKRGPEPGFMTAEKLGLKKAYYAGLCQLLPLLEDEGSCLAWKPGAMSDGRKIRGAAFDMSGIIQKHECGTVGCIMGWGMLLGSPNDLNCLKNVLRTNASRLQQVQHSRLTSPFGWSTRPDYYDKKKCGKALRSYLTTGTPEWS